MSKSPNYEITFSQQGSSSGATDGLGNPIYDAPTETTILCWLHVVSQGKMPPEIESAGIDVTTHMPMIGWVINPGFILSDGTVVPGTNVIPGFVPSSIDTRARHIGSGRSGLFKLYRRELTMAAHLAVAARTGVQIYGGLRIQG